MGTRAQIDVRQGKKMVRVYSQFDGSPRNVLPALRAAARSGCSTPLRIARAVIREFGGDDTIRIIDEDRSDEVSYRYVVEASSRPWRVRQTRMEAVNLPTKADGSVVISKEALKEALDDPKNIIPAVTRSYRIGE
jgi:hypothetical protein